MQCYVCIVRRTYELQNLMSFRGQFSNYVQAWLLGFMVVLIEAFMAQTKARIIPTAECFSRSCLASCWHAVRVFGFSTPCAAAFCVMRSSCRQHFFLIVLGERREAETTVARLRARGIMVSGVHCVPAASLAKPPQQKDEILVNAVHSARQVIALRAVATRFTSWLHGA